MTMISFEVKKASNYGYLRNYNPLHKLVKELLKTEETIFVEILKIIVICKTKEDYKDFFIRYLAEHKNDSRTIKCLSQLMDIYHSNYEIGGLRGRFLELLMFYLLKREYNKVDMRCFLSNGSKTSQKEIDVFGWDEIKMYGEFYECKINFEYIDSNDWSGYLRNLVEVNEIFNSNNKYGFVSLANDRAFFLYLKEILEGSFGFDEALILGRRQLCPSNFYKRAR